MAFGWKRVVLRGVKQLDQQDQTVFELKYVDEDDLEIVGDGSTGADVVLTGYTAQSAGAVSAAQTVNVAIAKLEARIAALEA